MSDTIIVTHNQEDNRFEVQSEGLLAVLEYELEADTIIFNHTGVPDKISSQGIGSKLVQVGLEYARAHELAVVPRCPFVASYIRENPEYQDLVRN